MSNVQGGGYRMHIRIESIWDK